MDSLKCIQAYVDFVSPMPLEDLAPQVSDALFGGIAFVGKDEGIWDEVPAMRLANDVMGLRVILGGTAGDDGGFTLEIEPAKFPWDQVPDDAGSNVVCDVSEYMKLVVAQIDGVRITPPSTD